MVVSAVLSGNRNFEGRVHPLTKANYLASPPLCVAYALAGSVDIDFQTDPVGKDKDGNDVHLSDLWPSNEELHSYISKNISEKMFLENYQNLSKSNKRWNELDVKETKTYEWEDDSTYIHNPPFFQGMKK